LDVLTSWTYWWSVHDLNTLVETGLQEDLPELLNGFRVGGDAILQKKLSNSFYRMTKKFVEVGFSLCLFNHLFSSFHLT